MKSSFVTLFLALGMLLLTACATIGPPQPPSLELPKPPSDLRATRQGERVALSWTVPGSTTDRQTIKALGTTRICRGLVARLAQCGTPVAEVAAQPSSVPKSNQLKVAGSYVDTLPSQFLSDDSDASITYAIEVLNTQGRGAGLSNQVRVPLVRTLVPPQDFTARVTGQGVVLTWKSNLPPVVGPVHYVYRVYRHPEGSQQQTLVGEVPEGPDRSVTLTDSNIHWDKTYEYRAETVTVIAQENKPEVQVEGEATPEVKVLVLDIFPPAVPAGLQAVFSGPGQKPFIDLIWAPVTDVDLEGYNVYRREDGAGPVKLNADLLQTPAYRDVSVVAGKSYLYSVSAVDVRGNESARSDEAGETVP